MDTNKYVVLAKLAKTAARDILRTRWITNLLGNIRDLEAAIKASTSDITVIEKNIAVLEFEMSQAKKNGDPRMEDIKKTNDQKISQLLEAIVELTKNIDGFNKSINEVNKKIEDVTSGELKVSYENMVELSKTIVDEAIRNDVKNGVYGFYNADNS